MRNNKDEIVPGREGGITKRSSDIIRRGLESLDATRLRILNFPNDRSMGYLFTHSIIDKFGESIFVLAEKDFQEGAVEARGFVSFPIEERLILRITEQASYDLSPLADLNPDDLYTLDLGKTRVTDDELVHIDHLSGLDRLILSETPILGLGLKFLGNLTNLRELNFAIALEYNKLQEVP